jgi:transcriptional regulator with XRE-family HTH domain
MPIGQRVKRLRNAAGLTQQALAMKTGLSMSSIIHLEAGRTPNPRADTLKALAGALGTSVDVLLSEDVDLLTEETPAEKPKRPAKPRGKAKGKE